MQTYPFKRTTKVKGIFGYNEAMNVFGGHNKHGLVFENEL